MDIKKLVSREYFISTTNVYFDNFYSKPNIRSYISNTKLDDLNKLVQEFWDNPGQNIIDLKEKYQIVNGMSVYDIVKANSCEKYIDFLLDCWDNKMPIKNIIQKYSIPYNRIENILQPLKLSLEELYCPSCFKSNEVTIDSSIKDIKKGQIKIICTNCKDEFSNLDNFLTKIQADEQTKILQTKEQEFFLGIDHIKSQLKEIRCYKCQNQLEVQINSEKFTYYLKCTKCRKIIDNIDEAKERYDMWEKKEAMLCEIKAEERRLIEKILGSKKRSDIIFKKEEIIRTETNEVQNFFYEIQQKEAIIGWKEIYKILKECNWLNKLVLSKILQLCRERGRRITWNYFGISKEIEVYRYSVENQRVVISLYNKIEIVMLRQELRKLINKKLIVVDEESNYIDTLPLLVDNLELIDNMLKPQKVDSNLRYFIFQRNDFACKRCGSTERPLRIAYVTSDKNNHDLNLMTCLCDYCFEEVTENEVLIDGTFAFENEYFHEEKLVAWEFLISNFSTLKNSEKAYNEVANLSEYFEQLNIIKAFVITIDRIKDNRIEATVAALIRYSKGILNNTLDSIDITERLFNEYNLGEWFSKV